MSPSLQRVTLLSFTLLASSGPTAGDGPTRDTMNPWQLNDLETRAREGETKAEVELGTLYQEGRIDGLPDQAEAAYWYLDAAERGDPQAWRPLGELYLEGGGGMEQDFAKARYWLLRAAKAGDSRAQYDLGRIYTEGLGVAPDWPRARQWLERAARQGDREAIRYLKRHMPSLKPTPSAPIHRTRAHSS